MVSKTFGPVRQKRRIVLAGNPNSGKTTIFNGLTGSHQRVGNYPGVTVEKKQGRYDCNGTEYTVLDLPGTYSLTCFSPEERIARKEIIDPPPDVTVVVVDSTNLERNLYLLVQVMEMGANPVLCLNMSDEAHKAGQRIDVEQMASLLGFPVVETVGHKRIGLDGLKEAVDRAASQPADPNRLVLGDRLDRAVGAVEPAVKEARWRTLFRPHARWAAIKLVEGDLEAIGWVRDNCVDPDPLLKKAQAEAESLAQDTGLHPGIYIAEARYGFAAGLLRECRINTMRGDARRLSDTIDDILCHRSLGVPFFLVAMYLIFWLTFSVGAYPMGWLEAGFGWLGNGISALWPEGAIPALRSLIVDGVIGGVGGVVVFLPNILLLFLGLAFLEDTGYMARAAFLMDSWLHRFGLHGKSFIPLVTGFGCSVPGIMATRTLENERDRLATMLVLPLMSCGARLPIYMLIIPAFFPPQWHAPMLWLIYITGIALAAGLAKLLRSTLLAGEDAPFVMELPPYRLPTMKAVLTKMWERGWVYVRKAGTIILGISIVLWALTALPVSNAGGAPGPEAIPASLEEDAGAERMQALRSSIAGRIGGALEVVIAPMGFDWRIGTALLGALAAKEVFVAQMGIIMSLGEAESESETLREALRARYTPLTAFCLMLFLLIAAPCMATVAVTRRESGRWRWALLQFGGLTLMAYVLTVAVYQIGTLIGA